MVVGGGGGCLCRMVRESHIDKMCREPKEVSKQAMQKLGKDFQTEGMERTKVSPEPEACWPFRGIGRRPV